MNVIRPSVLIIDYEEEILIALEHLLEDEGFDTTTAWTGRDALKAARERRFDLVLVNEYLPDMDADRFTHRLSKTAGPVPFVVMRSTRGLGPNVRPPGWEDAIAVVCKRPAESVVQAVRTFQRCDMKHIATSGT